MSNDTQVLSDVEVTRVAMRITMSALSQLHNESEHLNDAEILKKYIQMCPFVSPNCPAIQAALEAVQNDCNNEISSKQETNPSSPEPMMMNSESRDENTVFILKDLKTTKKSHRIRSIILVFLRTILLDTPLALIFAIYLGLVWTHRLNDLYFSRQLRNLEWTDERAYHETTYYKRHCDAQDMTTRTSSDLFLDENSTPEEAYAHNLKHGMTVFPNVLSEPTATRLRDFIVKKNRNLTEDEVIYVINNQNRYSFGLGTEEPSVVNAVKEIARHPRLKPALEKILGPNPALIEMTAITAAYGAVDQYWHDDVISKASALQFGRAFGPSYSIFIQLQNTTTQMGATSACPGTHMCAEGLMDKFCDRNGFQVVNEDNYWRLGDAMLMNMNSWHRGAGHSDPNGPDRVMMIMTFVPKPRTWAETRQLSQGITFSLRWDMWGHTLGDLANADTAMTQPWATLRALGLYKAKDADWGLDFVTGASHRIANGDHGFRDDQIEDLIENGGFKQIPKFLHGVISEGEGWHEYILNTLINCEIFANSVHIAVIAGYIFVQVLILVFSLILSSNKRSSFARFCWAIVRLGVTHALVYGIYKIAVIHVDNTQWAKDLLGDRLYTSPFGLEDNEYDGPTTFPHRSDILIDTRYSSDYLAMYRDYISVGHPGNLAWNGVVDVMSPVYGSYTDDLFRNAVAENAVDSMLADSRRFLYQNPESHWVWMSRDDAIKHTKRHLKINSNPIVKRIVSKIDHLISECKYGYLRDTAMVQVVTKPYLEDIKKEILAESARPIYPPFTVRVGDQKKFGVTVPFPPLFKVEKPLSTARFVRRSVNPHREIIYSEPRSGAWIKAGDIVEGYFSEANIGGWWYVGTVNLVSSQGLFAISFEDGTNFDLEVSNVRRYRPAKTGEEFECLIGGAYRMGTVQSANSDGTYNVYIYESQEVLSSVPFGLFRRSS